MYIFKVKLFMSFKLDSTLFIERPTDTTYTMSTIIIILNKN